MHRSFKLKMALFSLVTSGLIFLAFALLFMTTLRRVGQERTDRHLYAVAEAQLRRPPPPDRWERVDASLVEPQPVERPLVQARALDVGRVRGEHLGAALVQQHGRLRERSRDRVVAQPRARGAGRRRLPFDLVAQRHFCMYSRWRGRVIPAHIERG